MVHAEVYVVVSHEVPHPAGPVLLLGFDSVGGVGHVAFGDGIGEDALLLLGVVEAEGGADVEALEGVDVEVSITEQAPVGVAVVLVALQACQRVLAVGIAAHGAGKFAGGGVHRQRGVELQHVFEEAAGGLHFGGAVDGEVFAEGHHLVEKVVLGVHTSGEAFEVGVLDDTHVLVVAQREECAHLVGGAAHAQVVILGDAGASGFVEPVCVGRGSGAGSVEVAVHGDGVEHRVAGCVVAPIVVVAEAVGVGVLTVVDVSLPHGAAVAFGVEHLELVGVELGGHRCIEGHAQVFTLLGGDDDHTIGRTRTVD